MHPRANGEAERFMQMLNKTERVANLQGKNRLDRQNSVQDMLVAYRSTPHPATGVTPYEAMSRATIRTKMDHVEPKLENTEFDEQIDQRENEETQRREANEEKFIITR